MSHVCGVLPSPTRPRQRVAVRRRLAAVTLAIVLISGCGGDDDDSYSSSPKEGGDLESVVTGVRPEMETWASMAAEKYLQELPSTDPVTASPKVATSLGPDSAKLSAGICKALTDEGVVADTDGGDAAGQAVEAALDEATMSAFGAQAPIMIAIGLKTLGAYPSFMWNDSAASPDTPIDSFEAMKGLFKPEFISTAGLKFPASGAAMHTEFVQWYSQDLDNAAFALASATTRPVRDSVKTCVAELSEG